MRSAPAWDGTGCEFDSWQCRIYVLRSLSLRLLGSFRGSLGTYGLTQKLCLKYILNTNIISWSIRPAGDFPMHTQFSQYPHNKGVNWSGSYSHISLAGVITNTSKYQHFTPILKQLHWLPIEQRIEYKLCLLTYKTLTNQQPTYLYNCLSFPSQSASTRSSDSLVLSIPYVRSSLGQSQTLKTLKSNISKTVRGREKMSIEVG